MSILDDLDLEPGMVTRPAPRPKRQSVLEPEVTTTEELPACVEHFKLVPIDDLEHAQAERPANWWGPRLPAGAPTLFGAHGGTGKSTIAEALGVCIALGRDFLGIPTRQGNVAYYSAEDGAEILRHRMQKICRTLEVDPAEVSERLHILDATENDPTLFQLVGIGRGGAPVGMTTPAFEALGAYLDEHEIDVLIVDNASDVYDASEIDRSKVKAFMRSLASLAKPSRAVLLLAHIDKQVARGEGQHREGYSGSTAWHNSARSRLFLSRDKDSDMLKLEHQKNNFGRTCEPLELEWPEGAAMPQLLRPLSGVVAHIEERNHIKALIGLVHEFTLRGEHVPTATAGPHTAARMFSKEPRLPRGLKSAELFDLLRSAERQGLLMREGYTTAARNKRERWAVTEKGLQTIEKSSVALVASVSTNETDEGRAQSAFVSRSRGVGGLTHADRGDGV